CRSAERDIGRRSTEQRSRRNVDTADRHQAKGVTRNPYTERRTCQVQTGCALRQNLDIDAAGNHSVINLNGLGLSEIRDVSVVRGSKVEIQVVIPRPRQILLADRLIQGLGENLIDAWRQKPQIEGPGALR